MFVKDSGLSSGKITSSCAMSQVYVFSFEKTAEVRCWEGDTSETAECTEPVYQSTYILATVLS